MKIGIPEENLELFKEKMQTFVKKAKKYNCEFTYEFIRDYFKVTDVAVGEECEHRYEKRTVHYFEYDVAGKAEINNWRFLASVENTNNGNIIMFANFEDSKLVDKSYYTSKPICEHCHTNRFRKYTYLILNTVTNEVKQVGKACLKDYTNGMRAEQIASLLSCLDETYKLQYFNESSNYIRYYEVKHVLNIAKKIINKLGYVKRKFFTDLGYSDFNPDNTLDKVVSVYDDKIQNNGLGNERLLKVVYNLIDENEFKKVDEDYLRNLLNWLFNIEHDESMLDYFNNLKVLCRNGYARYKHLALLISLIPAYTHYLRQEEYKRKLADEKIKSSYYGEVGKRYKNITVSNKKVIANYETMYGLQTIYSFNIGNDVLIWKTSTGLYTDKESFNISFTVKEHSEYKGQKQTIITRVICKE